MSTNKEFIKLPESELEVMQAIWALNAEGEKFVSAGLIMKRFPALCRLKLTTVLTLITRLQNKGFISSEKLSRSNCYKPLIDADEYRRYVANDFVERVYVGNRLGLISNLIEADDLSAEDIAELKKVIEESEKK
ncbi:MAG: BlaI/MecI/CopY family transcriptional regulator [Clostridia bacterium]|nr:BlaI/MecI/CopY family transcriptional regulator [Clostridia bacterium]